MKKKIINGILVAAILVAVPSAFVSCKDNDADLRTELLGKIADLKNQLDNIVLKAGPQGEQGVAGKDGKDGSVVTIGSNGNWFIDGKDTGIPTQVKGDVGAAGADGHTPEITIGDNGNWFVDGKDTGKQAVGKDGKDGVNGKDGKDGTNATVVEIKEVDGVKYWFIDGENTWVVAEGKNGTDGINGQDGTSIITIGDNGNWFIDGKDSGVPATGPKGADGKDGVNGQDGADGQNGADGVNGTDGKDGVTPVLVIGKDGHYYWWIDGVYTGVRADGIDGTGIGGDVWTVNPDTKTWVINGEDTGILAYTYQEMVELIRSLIYDAETGKLTPELEDQIKKLINSLEGAVINSIKSTITSVSAERTENQLYGQLSIPGWNPMILSAFYGESGGDVYFPEDDINLKGVEPFELSAGREIKGDGGKVFLTLNPAEVSTNGKMISLVTSQGKEGPFTLENLTESDEELTFGWNRTRSGNGLYEATAKLKSADAYGVNVDADLLKDYAKDVASDLRSGENRRAITKLANYMADAFSNAIETIPAYSVKVGWNDPLFGVRTVHSEYSIAAFSIKPLAYDFEYDKNAAIKKVYVDKVQHFFDKIINNIKIKFDWEESDYLEIVKLELNLAGGTATVKKQDGTTVTIDTDDAEFVAEWEHDVETLNDIIKKVNDINSTIETDVKSNLKKSIQDLLDKVVNRINKEVQEFSINQMIQPTLLVRDAKGLRKATGKVSGEVSLIPTSYTAELLAPAYKKFVVITEVNGTKAGKYDNVGELGEILDGGVQEIKFYPKAGETYTIAYSAMDFFGNVVTNYYMVTGE